MLESSLLMNKHSVVFIAGSDKSIVELVCAQVSDEFEKIITHTSSSLIELQQEFGFSYADVLILVFEDLSISAALSDALRQASLESPLKPYRVLALCSKSSVKSAYRLYGDQSIHDYIVYWPLNYDPCRLLLSLHQAVDYLKSNNNAKQLSREVTVLTEQVAKKQRWAQQVKNMPGYAEFIAMNLPLAEPVVAGARRKLKQVLVIDDDQFQHSVLRKLLLDEHFEIRFTDNGNHGLELMRRYKFNLILLDLMMPGMTGLEVMKSLRYHPEEVTAPIIVISGEHEKEVVVECLGLGAAGYIVKPYTQKVLLDKINKVLSHKP